MAAIFPGAVATPAQMQIALNNTKVLLDVAAGIADTTLTVDDASPLNTSGYLTFNDDEDNPETISYTGKTINTLTGVTRGADNTVAAAHVANGTVGLEARWNAAYHNILATEIIAVSQNISNRFGLGTAIVIPAGISFTAQATSNQLVLGTTRTVTINAPTPASASRIWTIPDIATAGTFAALEGTQTFTGTKTFSAAVTISATTNQLVLGVTNTITITSPAPASSRTYTIPDAGGAASFLLTAGAATVTGAKTFTSSTLLLQENGGTDVATIAVAALATGRTYTVPDAGGAADFLMTAGAQTITGTKTFSGATIAMGSNKITGLADGSATGDAINYGQIWPGLRNRVINGEMRIDQANAGAAITVATAGNNYCVDQFVGLGMASAGVFTLQRSTSTPPTGFTHFLRATCTTADASIAAGDLYMVRHYIEGNNIRDFQLGLASAVAFTLSFRVRSSLTGTYTGGFINNAGNRSYPFEYTINSANTWETKTVTLTGDTSGSWLTDTGIGLSIDWGLAVGSTFQSAANAWAAGNFFGTANQVNFMSSNTSRTWDLTGVQLEVGSVATPFEYRTYGLEFAMCQRYLQHFGSNLVDEPIAVMQCYTTTNAQGVLQYFMPMRAIPTFTVVGAASDFRIYNAAAAAANATAITSGSNGPNSCFISGTVASGLVAGNATNLFTHTTTSYVRLDARF